MNFRKRGSPAASSGTSECNRGPASRLAHGHAAGAAAASTGKERERTPPDIVPEAHAFSVHSGSTPAGFTPRELSATKPVCLLALPTTCKRGAARCHHSRCAKHCFIGKSVTVDLAGSRGAVAQAQNRRLPECDGAHVPARPPGYRVL